MKRLLLPVILLGVGLHLAAGDIVHLKDGTQIEGEIHRSDDGYTVRSVDGKVSTIPLDDVDSIELKASNDPQAQMERLTSLRNAVANISDLKTIVSRYQTFITQNAGTPVADAAKEDLARWQDRLARGLVRSGGNWITPEELAAIRQKMTGVAEGVRDAMKQGRLREAATVLDRALQDDPQNISLLYLRGVLHYREEQLPAARKSFEGVNSQISDHAPTLNNLAVILWRQNAMIPALNDYDAAMLAAPVTREILDNVAEALNALPENQRKGLVVDKVVRHFKEQDADLQKIMAQRGLSRWGSTWVTADQEAKLEQQQKQIQGQINQLSQDFDAAQGRVVQINQSITNDVNQMQQIEVESVATDTKGNTYRLPLPQRYYDLQNEINSFKGQLAAIASQQDDRRTQAKQLMQKLPMAKYTGIQKIIDVDGMPVPLSAASPGGPTTAPALPGGAPTGAIPAPGANADPSVPAGGSSPR